MSNTDPHLIEVTGLEDTERVYMKGPGVLDSDLTDAEKVLVERSKYYLKERRAKENERLVKLAREDFEKLRDIPNMPDEAIYILKRWTSRYEDDHDYEDYDIDEQDTGGEENKMSFFKKHKLKFIALLVLLVVFTGWRYWKVTEWERDLTIKKSSLSSDYEITNNTNRRLEDVKVIFACKDIRGRRWNYIVEQYRIEPHETVTVRVIFKDLQAASKREPEAFGPSYILKRVKYKKR